MSKTNTSPQQSSLTERAWLTCRKRPYLQGPRRAGFRTHRLVSGPCQTCQHKTRREQAAGTFPSVSPQDLRCCQGRAKGATLPFFPPNPHTSEEWRPHLLQNRQQECAAAYLFCERKSLPADCHLRPPSPDSPGGACPTAPGTRVGGDTKAQLSASVSREPLLGSRSAFSPAPHLKAGPQVAGGHFC